MFQYSEADIRKVKRLQFGILGPDEIKAMSVCHIESDRTFEGGKPVANGLMDPRLGSIDREINCTTCGMDRHECPGHFGHIELAKPMYHVSFITNIMKTLRCVCFSCSVILGDEPPDETGALSGDATRIARAVRTKKPDRRLRAVMEVAKTKGVCWSCSAAQPSYKKDGLMIHAEFKEATDEHERKLELTAERAHKVLKAISDADARRLGFDPQYARPDWMVITVLPVPPPQVRPSIHMESSQGRSEDDLTVKLMDIVRTNRSLREHERNGAPNHIQLQHVALLQYHLATFVTNTLPGVEPATTRSGRPLKSISQRLKGKEGRVRGNLMGKRVDFSARTVITGDPNLAIDEVGVPRSIARNLTYPEVVTPYNLDRLQELVNNGPIELPGALYIIRSDGMRLDLRNPAAQKHLQYGYKVERHIEDGDVVMFNRQPSLHKMSIMSHRVRIMPYSTFRLNLSVTTPYNADFDGDEMNLHVMQSMETRAEASEIMSVARCVVSPQSNKPVMGIVQDTLLGSRGFTRRDTFIEKDMMMNLVLHLDTFTGTLPVPAILKPRPLWTGKQCQSLILPDFSMARFSNGHPDDETDELSPGDTRVVIDRGELLAGMLDKKALGTGAGGIIHIIANEFGPQGVRAFIGGHQRLINHWILHRSYSIGIGDTIADAGTMDDIVSTIEESKREVKKLVEKAQHNKLECQPGRTIIESFENNVNQVLNKARDKAGTSAQKSLKESNNVKNMVTTGSKGSFINISQMIACVGQQNVEGKRIPYGFLNRTLPHFTKDDYGPESRGFVENSYLRGLTPQEFFFHAMGGREGLIDTAVKTAETGYIQRRLVKAMEGVTVKYDGTVRNSQGEVLQFLYGEDGMDAVRLENQKIAHVGLHIDKLRKMYEHSLDDPNYGRAGESPVGQPWMRPGLAEELKRDPAAKEELRLEFEQLLEDRRVLTDPRLGPFAKGKADPPSPVNMMRLIRKAQGLYPLEASKPSDLRPIDVVTKVRALLPKLTVVKGADPLSAEAQYNATYNFFSLLRSQLASKRVLSEHRLTPQAFDWLLGEIENRFLQHRVQPGEMVGALAAQSIGEPATQMTLNTFHYAGVSAKNVTLGVPRLKEIINVSKQPKTPSLTVFLKPECASDSEAAKEVQSLLEHTTLGSVTQRTEIWYDPIQPLEAERATVVEEDEEFVRLYYDTSFEEVDFSRISPWVLRIELDMEAMADKNLLMEDITRRIAAEYGTDELHVIHSEDNDDKLVLRVRLVGDGGDKAADADAGGNDQEHLFLQRIEANMLSEMTLRGIEKIKRVFMREPKRESVHPQTGALGMVTEWVLDTEGINFAAVASADRRIDHRRLMSNDICEIIRNLGVEAVRQSLLGELRSVIEFDGSYVNYRHLAMLCDVMTYRGHLLSVTRHGINRVDNGALARCSFEETVDVLMEAACFAECDKMQGVSENIMLGQLAPIGTGEFDLYLNTDMLEHAQPTDFDPLYDDGMMGMSPSVGGPGGYTPYNQSPFSGAGAFSPGSGDAAFSPGPDASPWAGGFSPTSNHGDGAGYSPTSPAFSPQYSPTSPAFSPTSPGQYSPTSPAFSPTSPSFSPTSPGAYSPTSPAFSPTSPAFSSTSRSPMYSPTSPAFSPTSPSFSPTSNSSRYSPTSPMYSPTSPAFSPTSPAFSSTARSPMYSPTSPAFSPTSPSFSPTNGSSRYSPTSPSFSPTSPQYSPTSPAFSPHSPAYSPTSPSFSPTSGTSLSATSPAFSPNTGYSPTSPAFSPTSHSHSRTSTSPGYSPTSPAYSPTSPAFSPAEDGENGA